MGMLDFLMNEGRGVGGTGFGAAPAKVPVLPQTPAAVPAPSFGARAGAWAKRKIGDAIGPVIEGTKSPVSLVAPGGLPLAMAGAGAGVVKDFMGEYFGALGGANTPAPAAAAAPATPSRLGVMDAQDAAMGVSMPSGLSASAATPTLPPVAPMTTGDIRGTMRPPSGTGAFVNNTTGAVTNLDTREAPGLGAAPVQMMGARQYDLARGSTLPSSDTYTPPVSLNEGGGAGSTPAGRFFGAAVNMKALGNKQARELATAKLGYDLAKHQSTVGATLRGQDITANAAQDKIRADLVGKGAAGAHATAQAQKENMAAQIAARLADPATPEAERERLKTAAGALYGRFETTTATVPQGYMGDFKKDIPVVTSRGPGAGAVRLVTPQQNITMAEAVASAKANKSYKSDAQVRADMLKKSGFKLVD